MKREELADLMVLLAVAEEGNFTRAAVRLGITQSAVSHAVRRLEASLGFRLLNRSSRSVSTTDMGEQLVASLNPAFAGIDAKIEELRSIGDAPAGLIRLTASATAVRTILWPVVREMAREYPHIQIEINTNSRVADLAEGRFDAAIRLEEMVGPDLIAVPVGPPVEMAAVSAPSYFEKHGIPAHPADLDHHKCIVMRFGPNTAPYDWEFAKSGEEIVRKVSGPFVFNESEFVVAAAREGHGIAYITVPEVREEIERGSLQRVLTDWCEPFGGFQLCYSSRRQMSSALRLLIDRLRYRAR